MLWGLQFIMKSCICTGLSSIILYILISGCLFYFFNNILNSIHCDYGRTFSCKVNYENSAFLPVTATICIINRFFVILFEVYFVDFLVLIHNYYEYYLWYVVCIICVVYMYIVLYVVCNVLKKDKYTLCLMNIIVLK